MLVEKEAFFEDHLRARCGNIKMQIMSTVSKKGRCNKSLQWQDVVRDGWYANNDDEGFSGNIKYNVVKGSCIPIWYANWCGNQNLKCEFSYLFNISKN